MGRLIHSVGGFAWLVLSAAMLLQVYIVWVWVAVIQAFVIVLWWSKNRRMW